MAIVCCICLDSTDSNFGVLRNCGHWYHETCIKKWFKVQKSCPLCKKDFIVKDLLLLPLEISLKQGNSIELENLKLENSRLLKTQKELEIEIKQEKTQNAQNYKLLKCLAESKKEISKLQGQLKMNLDYLETVRSNLEEEKAKRIKTLGFTKNWNFCSDFDLKRWQESWHELDGSLDSIDLKELLFDYHKKVGETNSWLLESNQTIMTLKKKLLHYKSVNKDLENQVEFLKIKKVNQTFANPVQIRETERIIAPGSFKKSKMAFNSLRFSEPGNRVVIEPEKTRSTLPFKRF